MRNNFPKKIAIIGPGLIGGSIFMGLKRKLRGKTELKLNGKADPLPFKADLIIIATPIIEILKVLSLLDKQLSKRTVVIDVGSTKETICHFASKLKNNSLVFVGTHPMAGSEASGFGNSRPDLFLNKKWIICHSPKTEKKEFEMITGLVKTLGAIPSFMTAKKHDQLVAYASHLSLLVSSLLVSVMSKQKDWLGIARIASTGFRDTTRLASHDPQMKSEIVLTNKSQILKTLLCAREEVDNFISLLKQKENKILSYFEKNKKIRDDWLKHYG